MDELPSRYFANTKEFHARDWILELPADVSRDDLLRPGFWRLAAAKLNRLDVITCVGGRDPQLDIDLRVLVVGSGYAVTRVIREATATEAAVTENENDQGARVEFRPGSRWCAISADGELISDGHDSREEAHAAIEGQS